MITLSLANQWLFMQKNEKNKILSYDDEEEGEIVTFLLVEIALILESSFATIEAITLIAFAVFFLCKKNNEKALDLSFKAILFPFAWIIFPILCIVQIIALTSYFSILQHYNLKMFIDGTWHLDFVQF